MTDLRQNIFDTVIIEHPVSFYPPLQLKKEHQFLSLLVMSRQVWSSSYLPSNKEQRSKILFFQFLILILFLLNSIA